MEDFQSKEQKKELGFKGEKIRDYSFIALSQRGSFFACPLTSFIVLVRRSPLVNDMLS